MSTINPGRGASFSIDLSRATLRSMTCRETIQWNLMVYSREIKMTLAFATVAAILGILLWQFGPWEILYTLKAFVLPHVDGIFIANSRGGRFLAFLFTLLYLSPYVLIVAFIEDMRNMRKYHS